MPMQKKKEEKKKRRENLIDAVKLDVMPIHRWLCCCVFCCVCVVDCRSATHRGVAWKSFSRSHMKRSISPLIEDGRGAKRASVDEWILSPPAPPAHLHRMRVADRMSSPGNSPRVGCSLLIGSRLCAFFPI